VQPRPASIDHYRGESFQGIVGNNTYPIEQVWAPWHRITDCAYPAPNPRWATDTTLPWLRHKPQTNPVNHGRLQAWCKKVAPASLPGLRIVCVCARVCKAAWSRMLVKIMWSPTAKPSVRHKSSLSAASCDNSWELSVVASSPKTSGAPACLRSPALSTPAHALSGLSSAADVVMHPHSVRLSHTEDNAFSCSFSFPPASLRNKGSSLALSAWACYFRLTSLGSVWECCSMH